MDPPLPTPILELVCAVALLSCAAGYAAGWCGSRCLKLTRRAYSPWSADGTTTPSTTPLQQDEDSASHYVRWTPSSAKDAPPGLPPRALLFYSDEASPPSGLRGNGVERAYACSTTSLSVYDMPEPDLDHPAYDRALHEVDPAYYSSGAPSRAMSCTSGSSGEALAELADAHGDAAPVARDACKGAPPARGAATGSNGLARVDTGSALARAMAEAQAPFVPAVTEGRTVSFD